MESGEVALLHCHGRLVAGLATERFREVALSYSERVLLIDASELEQIDAAGVGCGSRFTRKQSAAVER